MRLIIFLSFASFTNCIFAQSKEFKLSKATNIFSDQQLEHLVLTQYYRWFQTFESELSDERVKNHMGLLTDSILITTYNGPLHGKEGMKGFLNYVSSWKNSHHVEKVNVKPNFDGTISLEADIIYQNILPDGKQNAYKIHYTTKLKEVENELPLFTDITLLPTETLTNPTFEDAYTENRSKSFIHYWLYLIEDPKVDKTKFKELLASEFLLHFADQKVSDFRQFGDWLKEVKGDFKTTTHFPKNLKFTLNKDKTISISMDLEWKGITLKGKKMTGEIHSQILLENNPDERFARIKEMKSMNTKPIQIMNDF